jgi:hypothetical protein
MIFHRNSAYYSSARGGPAVPIPRNQARLFSSMGRDSDKWLMLKLLLLLRVCVYKSSGQGDKACMWAGGGTVGWESGSSVIPIHSSEWIPSAEAGNALTRPLDKCQRCLIGSDHGNIPLIEKGVVTDFGPCVEISDPREQVTDSRMNHCHATAVRQHVALGGVGSGSAMQARTRRCGEIPAPLRDLIRVAPSPQRGYEPRMRHLIRCSDCFALGIRIVAF